LMGLLQRLQEFLRRLNQHSIQLHNTPQCDLIGQ
jgi:hypothetical protein